MENKSNFGDSLLYYGLVFVSFVVLIVALIALRQDWVYLKVILAISGFYQFLTILFLTLDIVTNEVDKKYCWIFSIIALSTVGQVVYLSKRHKLVNEERDETEIQE